MGWEMRITKPENFDELLSELPDKCRNCSYAHFSLALFGSSIAQALDEFCPGTKAKDYETGAIALLNLETDTLSIDPTDSDFCPLPEVSGADDFE